MTNNHTPGPCNQPSPQESKETMIGFVITRRDVREQRTNAMKERAKRLTADRVTTVS